MECEWFRWWRLGIEDSDGDLRSKNLFSHKIIHFTSASAKNLKFHATCSAIEYWIIICRANEFKFKCTTEDAQILSLTIEVDCSTNSNVLYFRHTKQKHLFYYTLFFTSSPCSFRKAEGCNCIQRDRGMFGFEFAEEGMSNDIFVGYHFPSYHHLISFMLEKSERRSNFSHYYRSNIVKIGYFWVAFLEFGIPCMNRMLKCPNFHFKRYASHAFVLKVPSTWKFLSMCCILGWSTVRGLSCSTMVTPLFGSFDDTPLSG